MSRILQTRDPELSVFQSAIDEMAIMKKAGGAQSLGASINSTDRPGTDDPMVRQAANLVPAIEASRSRGELFVASGVAPTGPVAEGIGSTVSYCASLAWNLAKAKFAGDTASAAKYEAELTAVAGSCDARYAEAAKQTLTYFHLQGKKIPYVDWKLQSDFVLDDNGKTLPPKAKIAVIGDWGTGQTQATRVLTKLAEKLPDVVIHLGDVYYAGTENEQQHYFFDKWCQRLRLTVDADRQVVPGQTPRTFSLAGNHDMYCGGQPYYKMIKQLGQDASFFCLRNADWQFIGLDTGFNDHTLNGPCTKLPDRQSDWLKDKVDNAAGRKTVLLSHHQLFSNLEIFDAKDGTHPPAATNPLLLDQVKDVLPNVNLWLWGHQHDFEAYADPRVKARCMGHGGYPVGIGEIGKPTRDIPLDLAIAAQKKGFNFWDNGYAVIELDGKAATVTYYAVDENGNERSGPEQEII